MGQQGGQGALCRVDREWLRHDCRLPPLLDAGDPEGATIDELIALHAAYEMPTKPTSTQEAMKLALRPLHARFGSKLANDFRALDLLALRADMLQGGKLSRGMVNVRIRLVRSLFTWAAMMSRCVEGVPFRLAGVKPLRRGQATREGRVVQPIDWPTVEATLRHVSAPVRALALVQWHTGARPGEVCQMTADTIDRSGKVWVYVPATHKTAHHGKARRIFFGAEAQAVVRPFLLRRPTDKPLFSPTETMVEQRLEKAQRRRTRVQPNQAARARRAALRPKREVAEAYDVHVYRRALERGVDAANAEAKREEPRLRLIALATDDSTRKRVEDAIARLPIGMKRPTREPLVHRCSAALGVDEAGRAEIANLIGTVLDAPDQFERWHPHRLRHSFAHRAERETGNLDAVRARLVTAR